MEELEALRSLFNDFADQINKRLQPSMSFPPGSVPVKVAAKVYGKDCNYIRAGIIAGWLPIGIATRDGKQVWDVQEMDSRKGRISYYISPKALYDQTGFIWKGEKE